MSAGGTSFVSCVIVNFNGAHLLPDCLASLSTQDYPNLEILVADNGSVDDSEQVTKLFGARFLPLGRDTGVAVACNRGAAEAKGEFLFFVNNDMKFEPDCVSQLERALSADNRVFAADALQYSWDGDRIIHNRAVLAPVRSVRHTISRLIFPKPRMTLVFVPAGAVSEVPWGSGASLMVRRAVFRSLGGFDETFFLDFEDTDLCWRAWLRGWATVFVPDARVYHKWGASTEAPLRALNHPKLNGLDGYDYRRLVSQQKNHLRFAFKVLDRASVVRLVCLKTLSIGIYAVRNRRVAKAILRALCATVLDLPAILRARRAVLSDAAFSSQHLIRRFTLTCDRASGRT